MSSLGTACCLDAGYQDGRNIEFGLTPAQQDAADELLSALPKGSVCLLRAKAGMGRTSILRHLHSVWGGVLLGAGAFLDSLLDRKTGDIEEALFRLLNAALDENKIVFLDDLHLITRLTDACDYPRTNLLHIVLTAVLERLGKRKLVFASDEDEAPWPIRCRSYSYDLEDFTTTDHEYICRVISCGALRIQQGFRSAG